MNRIKSVIIIALIFCSIRSEEYTVQHEEAQDDLIRFFDYYDCLKEKGHAITRDMYEGEGADNIKQNFITIGLGCSCEPALNTRKYNIRTFAFPFDWCLTPYNALYYFINNDFKDYFKKENLVPSSKVHFSLYMEAFLTRLNYVTVSQHFKWVLDKQFGMIYNHDFPNNTLATIARNYDSHYKKYMRRIQRLYSEVNSGKHVYFIRYFDTTRLEAYELYKLLKLKFPKTNFTLIVIGDNPSEFNKNWNIPHIKNFYIAGNKDLFWKNLCTDIVKGIFIQK